MGVLLTGSSAGGLGALHNCEKVNKMMNNVNSKTETYCLVDAGFFFDTDDFSGHKAVWSSKWKNLTDTHNSSETLDDSCKANRMADDKWKCFLGNIAMNYVQRPTFLVQSVMDLWQLEFNYFSTSMTSTTS